MLGSTLTAPNRTPFSLTRNRENAALLIIIVLYCPGSGPACMTVFTCLICASVFTSTPAELNHSSLWSSLVWHALSVTRHNLNSWSTHVMNLFPLSILSWVELQPLPLIFCRITVEMHSFSYLQLLPCSLVLSLHCRCCFFLLGSRVPCPD